jgi:hypothetical protein
MKKAWLRNISLYGSICCFDLNLLEKTVQIPEFVKADQKELCTLEEMMLNLRQDRQNHQPLR